MAYIPFQQHFGEGAAVKLRTPQAPDWTAKYQLAAQERRAREAERARQDNAKSDNDALGKEYYKSLGGLDQNWFEKDYDQRDRMLTDIYATVRDAGNDYSNKGFQDKFTKQFNEYRAAQAISKNFRDKIDAKEKEMSDNGVDTYENLDVLENLNNGVYVFEGTDPTTGQPVKTEYNSDKIATGENPYEEFVRMSGVRGNLISKVRPKLNEGKYMGSVIDDAISNSRERTLKSTDAQGNQTWVERTDPTKYDQRILMGFTGRLKEDYEKAFKKDPQGFSSPEEQYLAKYKFSQGEKETGKFAPASSTYGQGATDDNWQKSAGKTSTFKYGDGLVTSSIGNYTITETPVTFKSGEAIDIKTGKKYTGSVTDGTMGQVQIIPINSKTGEITTSGATNAEYVPMVVVKVAPKNKWEEGDEILLPVSVGRGAAESKESKEEREALKKRFDWSEDWAKRANDGIKERDKGKTAKTIATKIQSTKDPKKFKVTYTDGTSEIITE